MALDVLGWGDDFQSAWEALGSPCSPARVRRIDRGWSTLLAPIDGGAGPERVRNFGADVAVGDWVVPSPDGERVEHVLARRSAFVRRASFEGARAVANTIAANIDIVFLCHSFAVAPNQRRLERELVLAFDSGAEPIVLLTKGDLVDDPEPARRELQEVALGVPVLASSGRTEGGLDELRGRHTTVAAELLRVPGNSGWLIDTPGVRALSLWLSGQGIERAFADVFELMDQCRFRDCKHDREPGCAVRLALEEGRLDPDRFHNLERLVAEEAALEDEQRAKVKLGDRRRRPPPEASESQ
jgi:ribosome biogenesis GTPase / thiamine phosphate phosphatase